MADEIENTDMNTEDADIQAASGILVIDDEVHGVQPLETSPAGEMLLAFPEEEPLDPMIVKANELHRAHTYAPDFIQDSWNPLEFRPLVNQTWTKPLLITLESLGLTEDDILVVEGNLQATFTSSFPVAWTTDYILVAIPEWQGPQGFVRPTFRPILRNPVI